MTAAIIKGRESFSRYLLSLSMNFPIGKKVLVDLEGVK